MNDGLILEEQLVLFRPDKPRVITASDHIRDMFGNLPIYGGDSSLFDYSYKYIDRNVRLNSANPGVGMLEHLWTLMVAHYITTYNEQNPHGDAQRILSNGGVNQMKDVRDVAAMALIAYGAGVHDMADHNSMKKIPAVERALWNEAAVKESLEGGAGDVKFCKNDNYSAYAMRVAPFLIDAHRRFFHDSAFKPANAKMNERTAHDDANLFVGRFAAVCGFSFTPVLAPVQKGSGGIPNPRTFAPELII